MVAIELEQTLQKGEEIQRMYQSANLLHADAVPVTGMGIQIYVTLF